MRSKCPQAPSSRPALTSSTEDTTLEAAANLLEREGPAGLTKRAVRQAAAITAPTLYHHFGDNNGLLNALVGRGIGEFLKSKRRSRDSVDPLANLRQGWNATRSSRSRALGCFG